MSIYFDSVFLKIILIDCSLSNRFDSEEAQQYKSLKWLSKINIFTLNLSHFWKITLE